MYFQMRICQIHVCSQARTLQVSLNGIQLQTKSKHCWLNTCKFDNILTCKQLISNQPSVRKECSNGILPLSTLPMTNHSVTINKMSLAYDKFTILTMPSFTRMYR